MTKVIVRLKGGSGSGHHGHAGRPGKIGGSLPGKAIPKGKTKKASLFDNKYDETNIKVLQTRVKAGLVSESGLKKFTTDALHATGLAAHPKKHTIAAQAKAWGGGAKGILDYMLTWTLAEDRYSQNDDANFDDILEQVLEENM